MLGHQQPFEGDAHFPRRFSWQLLPSRSAYRRSRPGCFFSRALSVGLLLLLAYLVGFDQGAVSQSGMYLHELMHDGRHLLGVPCH